MSKITLTAGYLRQLIKEEYARIVREDDGKQYTSSGMTQNQRWRVEAWKDGKVASKPKYFDTTEYKVFNMTRKMAERMPGYIIAYFKGDEKEPTSAIEGGGPQPPHQKVQSEYRNEAYEDDDEDPAKTKTTTSTVGYKGDEDYNPYNPQDVDKGKELKQVASHIKNSPAKDLDNVMGSALYSDDEKKAILKYLRRKELEEKAKSQAQQKAAGMALAAQRGEIPQSSLRGPAAQMAKMGQNELEKFARTKHRGLPTHKKS